MRDVARLHAWEGTATSDFTLFPPLLCLGELIFMMVTFASPSKEKEKCCCLLCQSLPPYYFSPSPPKGLVLGLAKDYTPLCELDEVLWRRTWKTHFVWDDPTRHPWLWNTQAAWEFFTIVHVNSEHRFARSAEQRHLCLRSSNWPRDLVNMSFHMKSNDISYSLKEALEKLQLLLILCNCQGNCHSGFPAIR